MVIEPDDWILGKERCGCSPSLMLRSMTLVGVYAAFESLGEEPGKRSMKMSSWLVWNGCRSAKSMSSKAFKIKTRDMTCWENEKGY